MIKLTLGLLYMLMMSNPVASCSGCDASLEFQFNTGNQLTHLRHTISIAVDGPGKPPKDLGTFVYGRSEVFWLEFEVTHSRQSSVRVNFKITDLENGNTKTVPRDLIYGKANLVMFTENDFR